MADQNQSVNVALTKNEILQNDLKKACEIDPDKLCTYCWTGEE